MRTMRGRQSKVDATPYTYDSSRLERFKAGVEVDRPCVVKENINILLQFLVFARRQTEVLLGEVCREELNLFSEPIYLESAVIQTLCLSGLGIG